MRSPAPSRHIAGFFFAAIGLAAMDRIVGPMAGRRSTIDQVVATFFAAPRSYTAEDVIEISAMARQSCCGMR